MVTEWPTHGVVSGPLKVTLTYCFLSYNYENNNNNLNLIISLSIKDTVL